MPGAVYGAVTQFGLAAGGAGAPSKKYNFKDCNLVATEKIEDMNGLRGTLSRSVESTRPGVYHVAGTIDLNPTALELADFLPWMLGTNVSGTTYALANLLQTRDVTMDRSNSLFGLSDGKVFTYPNCAIDKWTLKAAEGGIPLDLSLDVVGTTETVGNNGTFPTLTLDTASKPFLFTDLAFTISGTAYSLKDFEATCSWHIDRERFYNSTTLIGTYAMDRSITVKFHCPWAGLEAIYNTGSGGLPMVATFTQGGHVLTMTFASVVFPKMTPVGRGRAEALFPVEGAAMRTGATLELVTVLT